MPKRRVHELAKELGFNKQELVSKINSLELDISVDNYMSVLSPSDVSAVKEAVDADGEQTADSAENGQAADGDDGGVGPQMLRRRPRSESDSDDGSDEETDDVGPGLRRRRKVTPDDEEDTASTPESPKVSETPEPEPETETADETSEADDVAEEDTDVEADVEASDEETDTEDETDVEEQQDDDVEESTDVEASDDEQQEEQAEAAEADDEDEAQEAASDDEESDSEVADEQQAQQEGDADDESTEDSAETSDDESEDEAETQSDDESDADDSEEKSEDKPPKKPKRPPKKPPSKKEEEEDEGDAKVVGRINENILKERLAAEDKDFSPGPSRSKKKKKKKKKKKNKRASSHRTKRVVEGSDLYDGKSRRSNKRSGKGKKKRRQQTEITEAAEHKKVIRIEDVISVGDLAHEMGVKSGKLAMDLMEMGMQATVNTTVDYETASLIADEYDYTVENVAFDITSFYDTEPDPEEECESRAPVVTVMGHVDHGKTSLLDAVRMAQVTEEEAGGITQHIGAYMVETSAGMVTFLDTPGHEAFTALRMRGAEVTDLVVLVVAADDGVMPQTVEAINHARAAEVPIVVAINKIDKPQANPDRVKTALSEYELIPEEWGGTTLFVEVSALKETNIDGLLESVILQSEIEELTANPDRNAQGVVVEAELDIGRGPVTTMLVQRGTLHQGDILVSGQHYGRVRTMHDDRGQGIDRAGPSKPVEITGLSGIPEAGEPFFVVEKESDAKRITEHVTEQRRKETMASRAKEAAGSLEDLSKMIQEGEMKDLKIIVKADVQGSVEALKEAFEDLGNDEVRTNIIHTGVGAITENDVNLAASSETAAIVVGFNVRPDSRASEVADEYGVQVVTHTIIYDAIEQIHNILEGLLDPIVEEEVIGHAEVRDTFSTPRVGTVAGCYVTDGLLRRDAMARLLRDGKIVQDTEINSLRRFEDDVKEVKSGFECGASLKNFDDIKVGDVIEVYKHKEVAATLD